MRFDEPLLSAADERHLARAIEAAVLAGAALGGEPVPRLDATDGELRALVTAGEAARERFLLANCRLVQQVAHTEAFRFGLPADDLFQEGFLGLADAVERFDHALGHRFATLALLRIRARISDACRTRCGELHVSASVARRRGDAVAAPIALVTDERELQVPDERAAAAFDEVGTGGEFERLVADLPQLEREVLLGRFVRELSFAELAALLGLSASTLRRVHARALELLRGSLAGDVAA